MACCDFEDVRRYRCENIRLLQALTGDEEAVGTAVLDSDTDTSIPAGYQSVLIHKTNGSGTLEDTGTTGTYAQLQADDSRLSIEAPPGKVLDAITLTDNGGATWAWIGVK